MGATVDWTATVAKRVLMVVTNPGVSEVTGWAIGFWASELVIEGPGHPRTRP